MAPDKVDPVPLAENETRQFASKSMTRAQMLELAPIINVHINDSIGKHYQVAVANEAYEAKEEP